MSISSCCHSENDRGISHLYCLLLVPTSQQEVYALPSGLHTPGRVKVQRPRVLLCDAQVCLDLSHIGRGPSQVGLQGAPLPSRGKVGPWTHEATKSVLEHIKAWPMGVVTHSVVGQPRHSVPPGMYSLPRLMIALHVQRAFGTPAKARVQPIVPKPQTLYQATFATHKTPEKSTTPPPQAGKHTLAWVHWEKER
jgi:hypothetical protein